MNSEMKVFLEAELELAEQRVLCLKEQLLPHYISSPGFSLQQWARETLEKGRKLHTPWKGAVKQAAEISLKKNYTTKMKRRGKHLCWTASQDRQLLSYIYKLGLEVKVIANLLGKTDDSIRGRHRTLKLIAQEKTKNTSELTCVEIRDYIGTI